MILALIQGAAAVLPIDAGAHAQLLAHLTGWKAGSIIIAVQVGALLALLLWLWRDVALIGQGLWKLRKARVEAGARLLGKALIAAVPWIVADSLLPPLSFHLLAVGLITVACALLMAAIDLMSMTVKRIEHLTPAEAGLIGGLQWLALIPGVGRVAVALTTARLIGLERPAAYRFMLLATTPVLMFGIGRNLFYFAAHGASPSGADLLTAATTFTLVLIAVALASAWIRRAGLFFFAFYRFLVGALMIWLGLM